MFLSSNPLPPSPTHQNQTTARVWDSLFVEGPKILFRVALALLKRAQRPLLATRASSPLAAGAVVQVVRAAAAGEHDRDGLMKTAFDGLGTLSMKDIDGRREEGRQMVERELAGRRRPPR